MGKVKSKIYWHLTADILTNVLQKSFVEWSSTKHIILDKTSTEMLNLRKNTLKINSSEVQGG